MVTIVQKYGGTSVETPQHFLGVAKRILEEKGRGRRLIVVVSAMGQSTDDLVALARQVSPNPPRREMDMLLTAGERISMALLAIALESSGVSAISFTGSQSGIITDDRHNDARIVAIRPFRIEEALSQEKIVIVAGFQGVSQAKEVTTLGRGGSDTTAVALAIRFGSPWCEIFTDVHGVLTADPRIVGTARTLPQIGYEPAIVLSHLGAGVMFRRSVILARKYGMPIRVGCSLSDGPETWIGPSSRETVMTGSPKRQSGKDKPKQSAGPEATPPHEAGSAMPPADFPTESDRVLSVALEKECRLVEIEGGCGEVQLAALLEIASRQTTWLWLETHATPLGRTIRGVCAGVGPDGDLLGSAVKRDGVTVRTQAGLAVVSLVGEGVLSHPGLLHQSLTHLAEKGIRPLAARSGSLSLSFLILQKQGVETVRILHDRFVSNIE